MKKKYNWNEIQNFYNAKNTLADIQTEFGISYTAIKKARIRGDFIQRDVQSNIQILKSRCAGYSIHFIQQLYDEGYSLREISRKLNISLSSLSNLSKQGKLKTRTLSEASKLVVKKYPRPKMGIEARQKLSTEQSIKNRGGKCKWFLVEGQLVQGTWEKAIAEHLSKVGIEWIKLKTHKDVWPYVLNGKIKSYTPDFFIPKFNLYLEIKGHWWGNDKQKIEEVLRQHNDKKLILITKKEYFNILNGNMDVITPS
jgi:predicted DNA-binding protein YlxM (UPF0122 family)